jgi:multidrug resistance efflux pump
MVFGVQVKEGSLVRAGDPVMLVRNLELARNEAALARAVDSLGIREAQARAAGAEGQAGRIAALAKAEAARLAGVRERIGLLTIRAPGEGIVATSRPDTLAGRMVSVGDTLLRLNGNRAVEARIALAGAGASLARAGQRVRLVAHADPGVRLEVPVASVAASAASDGNVESRARLPLGSPLRPGMTGEARVTLRESTAWGALWWAVRSRIRTDLLL